ncbi:GntR family transcriptional regulator [Phenylobacterium immobile]|uniref:GntR family transcriptional regulator n=1 Tax=Phenylobacterium immobile TaxID=21 RepID=UPI000A773BE2|nr:GntR family transcriptional regulator [Phenylobacterium immobile]
MDENAWVATLRPYRLDANLPTPLYDQIYLVLRERIKSGRIGPYSLLPSEPALCRVFGVSAITIKRALKELVNEGLVARYQGRGTYVSGAQPLPVVIASFDDLADSPQIEGFETTLELLEVAVVPAPDEIATALKLANGAGVQRAVRRCRVAGSPLAYLVTFVPLHIANLYTDEDLATTPMEPLFARIGVPMRGSEEWLSSTAAAPHIASALETAIGAPLLKLQRLIGGPRGELVQILIGYYHPDRFRYRIRTRRRRTQKADKIEATGA